MAIGFSFLMPAHHGVGLVCCRVLLHTHMHAICQRTPAARLGTPLATLLTGREVRGMTTPERDHDPAVDTTPDAEHDAGAALEGGAAGVGAVGGAIVGGAVGGPPGVIAGAIAGASLGGATGAGIDEAEQHEASTDEPSH